MPGRVKRSRLKRKFTRSTYGKALSYLLTDFGRRCAYSLVHYDQVGGLEVDHFNPRLKQRYRQAYSNLMPALRCCNAVKSNTWPSKADLAAGMYLIDPTKEVDYGHQIFGSVAISV
jgi:5-methylcytosine-specific restriction endonuclease McrA